MSPPSCRCGSFSARAVVGSTLPITATVFREGHDAVAADVVLAAAGRRPDAAVRRMAARRRSPTVADRPSSPDREGLWTFRVEAWSDPLATWHHAVEAKIAAGQGAEELANDLEVGARLLERVAGEADPTVTASRHRGRRRAARHRPGADRPGRAGARAGLQRLLHDHPVRELVTALAATIELWVDRPRALYGSWYEFFPRSEGAVVGGTPTHGTFAHRGRPAAGGRRHGLRRRLPAADPPDRPGEPQGPEQHPRRPDAGRRRLAVGDRQRRGRARRRPPGAGHDGRLQGPSSRAPGSSAWRWRWTSPCSPRRITRGSTEHPEWFTTKPDGTIAYAENPPKKYQDIYPINFDNDPEGIYAECCGSILLWIDAGVRIFRVDNPHTKPLNFWHWLIGRSSKTIRTCCSWPRRSPGRR